MTVDRPLACLCRPAFLRPTLADPSAPHPARAELQETPLPPIRSRCARVRWSAGWTRLAMELAIQVGRVPARRRDESARILRLVRRVLPMRVGTSRPPTRRRREATRGFAKSGSRPLRWQAPQFSLPEEV